MNRLRAMLCLIALVTMSIGSAMAASPRDAPEYYATPPPETHEERRSRRLAEMETALGRLEGRFGIERPWVMSHPPPPPNAPRTMMDCVAIGEGKGVHCVLLTVRPQAVPAGEAGGVKQRAPDKPLRPGGASRIASLTEYGLDPNAVRVRLMTVKPGSAVLMAGRVSGNTLTMWGRCWNSPPTPPCEIEQRLTSSADGEDISITDYGNWAPGATYTLRRLSQQEVDEASWNVEGARPTFPTKPRRPR